MSLKYIFIKMLLLQTYLFFFLMFYVFILAAQGLCCCIYMLSLVAVNGSYSLAVVRGLLVAVVSLVVEHEL